MHIHQKTVPVHALIVILCGLKKPVDLSVAWACKIFKTRHMDLMVSQPAEMYLTNIMWFSFYFQVLSKFKS